MGSESKLEFREDMLILGVHLNSEGYPNVKYRIESLKRSPNFSVSEINCPMWNPKSLGGRNRYVLIQNVFRAAYSHLRVFFRYMFSRPVRLAYIPYPAVFICVMLSLLPRRFRPEMVFIDAFISLYDAVVLDRGLLNESSWVARSLKRLEGRAFLFADLVFTDTEENSAHLSKLYNLSKSKFIAVPLSTDEEHFCSQPYNPVGNICNVLFVGTLVPLHGIETILEAIDKLKDEIDIRFTLIGDGQEGHRIEQFIENHNGRIVWIREWQDSSQISKHITQADICLGIFGRGGKTQRVCPLKLYAYAACGRAIITAETRWARRAFENMVEPPFATLSVGDGNALAQKIKELTHDVQERKRLADSAEEYYKKYLSNEQAIVALENTIIKSVHGLPDT